MLKLKKSPNNFLQNFNFSRQILRELLVDPSLPNSGKGYFYPYVTIVDCIRKCLNLVTFLVAKFLVTNSKFPAPTLITFNRFLTGGMIP